MKQVVLKSGDKEFEIPLGESLRKGKEINVRAETKREPTPTEPKS